jgi:hypothetical protein
MAYATLGGGRSSSTTKRRHPQLKKSTPTTKRTTSTTKKTTSLGTIARKLGKSVSNAYKTIDKKVGGWLPGGVTRSSTTKKTTPTTKKTTPTTKKTTSFHNIPTAAMTQPKVTLSAINRALNKVVDILDIAGKPTREALYKSITGKSPSEKVSGEQLFTTAASKSKGLASPLLKKAASSPVGRAVGGSVTEVVTDPLNWIPIGGALKVGGKILSKADDVVRLGKALSKVDDVSDAARAAKALSKTDDVVRATKSLSKVDDVERAITKPATSAIERRLSTIKPKPIETIKPKPIQIKPIANQAAKEVAEEAVETPGKQLLKESVKGATKLSKPSKSVLEVGVEQAAKQTFKEGAKQATKQTAKEAVKEGLETAIGQTAKQATKAATTSGLKNIANLAKKVLPYAAVGGAAALLATPSGEQQQPTMNQPETQQIPTGQQNTNNGWVDLKDVQSKLEQQYPTYPTSQAGIPTQTKTSHQTKTSQPGITSQTTGQSQQPIIDTTTLMDNVNNSIEDLITLGTIELNKPDTSPDVLAVYNQYLSDILSSIEKRMNDLKSTAEQQGKELDQSTLLTLETLRQRLSDELKSVREELNRRGLYESGILLELETKLRNNELSEEARILSDRLSKIYDNLNNNLNQLYNAAIDVQSKYGLAAADAYAKAKADYEQQRQDLLTKLINARLEQRSQLSKEQQAALDRQLKEQQATLDRQLREKELQQENYWKQLNYNLQQQKAASSASRTNSTATNNAINYIISSASSREEALNMVYAAIDTLISQGVDVAAVISFINSYFK